MKFGVEKKQNFSEKLHKIYYICFFLNNYNIQFKKFSIHLFYFIFFNIIFILFFFILETRMRKTKN